MSDHLANNVVAMMLAEITDFHVDVDRPAQDSVVFPGPSRVPPELVPFVEGLADEILEAAKAVPGDGSKTKFNVRYQGVGYRVNRVPIGGKRRFALRRLPAVVKSFDDLEIPKSYQKLMMRPEYRQKGGLMLFAGAPGAGKTTTASTVVKSRLEAYGGFAITAEDPPEFPLGGFHGKGYCDVTEISGDTHAHMKELLRCFPAREPAMLYYGEVRDAKAAAELLRIAIDGHLVLSTIHASGPEEALHRLITMAAVDGEMEARELLASALRLVVHQRLDNNVLQMTTLESDATIAATIRNGRLSGLKDTIQAQAAVHRNAAAPGM